MGRYVNQTTKRPLGVSFQDKISGLLDDGAVEIPKPENFVENLVCVVNNGPFAAAAHCYDKRELVDFSIASDTRPKRWFIWDKVKDFAQ